jgi:uncharacterized membrane protein
MRLFFIVIFYILSLSAKSQDKIKISGKVVDFDTDSPLIGATVYIFGTSVGSITNEHGIYSLYLTPGTYTICASYLGYKTDTLNTPINSDQQLNIKLKLLSVLAEEVIVSAKNSEDNVKGVESGEIMLSMREIKKLPTLMGETDFMRIIQMTPGISAANDGNSGFYVRGGGADQNLVLLDNAPIYNPNHILGFFSVFNAQTISNTTLIKSGMPANYGGRLSSIISFSGRDGDLEKYCVNGNVGILSSAISVEGPMIKEKISFIVSFRRSYIDEVLKPIVRPFVAESSSFYNSSKYYFYDFNGKISFQPNQKDKITLTLYQGEDNYSLEKFPLDFKNQMSWGNDIAVLNWSHNFNSNLNILNTFSTTSYGFNLEAEQNKISVDLLSDISEYTFKSTLTNAKNSGTIIKAGIEHIYRKFHPNNLSATTNDVDLQFGSNRELNSHETSLFYNHEFDLTSNFRIAAGLRFTNYMHVGPYYQMSKNEIGEITDTTYYKSNELIKTYQSLEPRISLRYQLDRFSSIKASYTQNNQYTHMVSASAVTLPTDVWLPSTNLIKPQKGSQYTLGYFRNFSENNYISSFNIYYKDFFNQIELLSGLVNNYHDNIFEENVSFGSGNSYGIELFIQKTIGNFTGWLGYTLSKTNRKFDEINNGKIYPAKYDRRHDINVVASYDINEKWSVSSTFIYATGNAFTLPEAKYIIEGNIITEYGDVNAFRMPDYHRLDLSINYILKKTKKFESMLNFSVFNVYNRSNPFYIYFEITGNVYDGNIEITPEQITLFPILPSITWNFKF